MTERIVTAPEGGQTISFTREFAGSRELVFRAHTDESLIGRWIGPRGTTVRMEHWDARTGGGYSYAVVADAQNEWAFYGSFHQIVEPERLVQTWEYRGDASAPLLEVLTFVDLGDGRTRLEGTAVYLTADERDAALGDFDQGRDEDFARLDDLLPELATT